jgi:GNAT superfamily N-acetyltransferase
MDLQLIYRLTACPEPCLGLFIEKSGNPETEPPQLIAHVIGNRVSANRITDSSMSMPEKWQERSEVALDSNGGIIGHDPAGRFIGVHSVAVRTEHQGKGLGRDLMKEYAKYVRDTISPVDSVVLIAHGHLLRFYESVGFKNLGPSPSDFAGGGWYNMVSTLLSLRRY